MCGIVGFTGSQAAAPLLLDGLRKLEYRGYDSAGIAVQKDGVLHMIKASGHIDALAEKQETVLELTAASTAASAAITLLPGDTATPIAEKLAEIKGTTTEEMAQLTLKNGKRLFGIK